MSLVREGMAEKILGFDCLERQPHIPAKRKKRIKKVSAKSYRSRPLSGSRPEFSMPLSRSRFLRLRSRNTYAVILRRFAIQGFTIQGFVI